MKVCRHHLFNYLLFTILHKSSIVQHFKEPMKATKTAEDIVSKNPHGNVCCEVIGKVLACQHGNPISEICSYHLFNSSC